MSSSEADKGQKIPFLERFAISFFEKNTQQSRRGSRDAVHVLNTHEKQKLRKVQVQFIAKCALAGAVSAFVASLAHAYALKWTDAGYIHAEHATWFYWVFVMGVTLICVLAEIAYIYVESLKSVSKIAKIAGLDISRNMNGEQSFARVLARAALEIPNPKQNRFNIDSTKEASKVKLIVSSLLYKGKITLTNLLVKLLVRRLLTRSVARYWLEMISVPVSALWNAMVAYVVMHEVRIRAMGPSAAEELVRVGIQKPELWTESCKVQCFRAIALCMVRSRSTHPNLLFLMETASKRIDLDFTRYDLDESDLFFKELKEMSVKEQLTVLKVLTIASIIDGRLSKLELKLIDETSALTHIAVNAQGLDMLSKKFLKGREISVRELNRLFTDTNPLVGESTSA